MILARTLTLEDRRKIEMMWRGNVSPVKIAATLEISQCTVYKELKRGQETSKAGDVVLDENFRPAPLLAGKSYESMGVEIVGN